MAGRECQAVAEACFEALGRASGEAAKVVRIGVGAPSGSQGCVGSVYGCDHAEGPHHLNVALLHRDVVGRREGGGLREGDGIGQASGEHELVHRIGGECGRGEEGEEQDEGAQEVSEMAASRCQPVVWWLTPEKESLVHMLRYAMIGTFLLSSAAHAAPTIAVVGLHQEELDLEAQKAAAARIVAHIDGTGAFEAFSPEEVAAGLEGREELVLTDAFLAHGRKLLGDGRLQFQQAEPDFAIPVLESAVKELVAAQPFTPSQKEYWEALVFLGASQNMTDDQAGMMQNFSAAAGLNPERRPSPRQFPPDIIDTYESLAGGMQGRASALHITAKGKDAQVWVDGVPRGKAPITVDVLPGQHHVMVRTPYGTSGYEQIAIGPKSSKDVDVTLQKTRLGLTSDSKFVRTRETAALYEALGDHLPQADFWLVTGEWQEALYAALYSPAADSWSGYVRVPLMEAGDDETIEALDELLAMIDNGGSLKRDAYGDTAIPLDRSANELLANLLVRAEVPVDPELLVEKEKLPVWVIPAIVGGVVVAGGGGYGLYRAATHEPYRGSIVIDLP